MSSFRSPAWLLIASLCIGLLACASPARAQFSAPPPQPQSQYQAPSPYTAAPYAVAQNPTDFTVNEANIVFQQAMAMPQNEIPRNLLQGATAIAIVPSLTRAAFVVGLQHGKGVLIFRGPNGAWQAPRMISVTGGSFGYQIGVQATDLILVFRSPRAVQSLLQGTLKVGVDASAAAGPIGRQTSASTDTNLGAEILSYSRARGLFAGVSIDGSSITLDPAAEAIYYQPPGSFPASAASLLQTINVYTATAAAVAPAPGAMGAAPAAAAAGWVAAGQASGTVEPIRQQLDMSSRQLMASQALSNEWRCYLQLPNEVYVPNQPLTPQVTQQALQRYEDVSRNSQYATLTSRPEFQQSLEALRKLSEVKTASTTNGALPPPPPLR